MRKLKIVIPKGRLNKKVVQLLNDVGLGIETNDHYYIPLVKDQEMEAKIMKPQNIPQLVEQGSHDVGFTGYDWIVETGANVEEVLDLGFNPVSIVAAIPEHFNEKDFFSRSITAASEYEKISRSYLDQKGLDYYFIRTFGATEVFPPDDADIIIDNTSTGRTLDQHKLKVMEQVLHSTTRMIVNKKVFNDSQKKAKIEELKTLIKAVLDSRDRVMLEMNIPKDKFNQLVAELPCMRAPTVSPLFNDEGFAVKIAVKKCEPAKLIPRLKAMGATDILEYEFRKVVL
jgi:ATP phosphoribosyltransferase